MTRKALGKGLEALFGNIGTEVVNPKTGSGVLEVEISKITPNPYQPRRIFSDEEIQELAESIRAKGLLQPILLRKHGEGFQIVAGERRFRAMRSLGKTEIPAQVRDQVSDRDMMEMALIENLQRVQLNPIEEALAFEALINECGVTHEEIADQLGKSRSTVTNTLRLLKLDPEVRTLIQEGKLTAGHGRALLQAEPTRQVKLARKIVEDQLTVRTAEQSGSTAGKRKEKEKEKGKAANPNAAAFIDKLRYLLGTKVVMKGSDHKGVLEIHYMSRNDLENLGDLLQRGHDSLHGA
jgi:ParB family transcriptional regulator, chromosome partitioning protein